MDAEDLAKQCHVALRVAAGLDVTCALIVSSATITGSDIKVVIVARARTKTNPAAVVIRLRMREGQQNLFGRSCSVPSPVLFPVRRRRRGLPGQRPLERDRLHREADASAGKRRPDGRSDAPL